MVIMDFLSKFCQGGGKVACYRFEGAPHAVAFYLRKLLSTESGSVNDACRRKERCIVLDWIGH